MEDLSIKLFAYMLESEKEVPILMEIIGRFLDSPRFLQSTFNEVLSYVKSDSFLVDECKLLQAILVWARTKCMDNQNILREMKRILEPVKGQENLLAYIRVPLLGLQEWNRLRYTREFILFPSEILIEQDTISAYFNAVDENIKHKLKDELLLHTKLNFQPRGQPTRTDTTTTTTIKKSSKNSKNDKTITSTATVIIKRITTGLPNFQICSLENDTTADAPVDPLHINDIYKGGNKSQPLLSTICSPIKRTRGRPKKQKMYHNTFVPNTKKAKSVKLKTKTTSSTKLPKHVSPECVSTVSSNEDNIDAVTPIIVSSESLAINSIASISVSPAPPSTSKFQMSVLSNENETTGTVAPFHINENNKRGNETQPTCSPKRTKL